MGGGSDGIAQGTYLLLLHNAVTFITGFVLAAVQERSFCSLSLSASFSLNLSSSFLLPRFPCCKSCTGHLLNPPTVSPCDLIPHRQQQKHRTDLEPFFLGGLLF